MEQTNVREPAVAGMFYPDDPLELRSMITKFLQSVPILIPETESVAALVSPHAGYIYSGLVAAYGYKQLEGRSFDTVIVISPSHVEGFMGVSVFPGTAYRTPLGEVPVNREMARKLTELSDSVFFSGQGHDVKWDRGEHALEVQLPFLQTVLPDGFKMVPLVMGSQSQDVTDELARVLSEVFEPGKSLLIASSDLSHYHPYDTANKLDHKLIKLFEAFDSDGIQAGLDTFQFEACGGGPIVSILKAIQHLEGVHPWVLHHANSGDVHFGNKHQVVGYFSGAVSLGGKP